MNQIHATAIVSPGVKLGTGNMIGPYCYICPGTRIGDNNTFTSHVCIGTPGQYRDRMCKGGVEIGSRNTFREFSQVHAAMDPGKLTIIGNDGYFMASAHIAHDCVIEDGVTLCNNATLGGDVRIMQGATLGFGAIVHQRQVVGSYSMLGMGCIVPKGAAIEPGEKYAGNPATHIGRNIPALKKAKIRNLSDEAIRFFGLREVPTQNRLIAATAELQQYMETRSREFQPRRYEILRDVICDLPYLRMDDAANLYSMAFTLCWQQHEDFQADQILIRELLIDTVTGGRMPAQGEAKGKVGWLLNHVALGTYAPFKHVYAYLSGMEPCEIIVHGNVREQEAKALVAMGHEITQVKGYPSQVVPAIKKLCREKNIAALIADIYTAIPLWCFMERIAPLQAYLSPGFQLFPADVVLLPETQEVIRNTARLDVGQYEFIPTCVLKEHLCTPVARKPKGKIFGILSRAEKCSREFLVTVGRILDEVPGAEFHFYGRGELEITHPKFKAMGICNPHEALSKIDVYLDSFPTCGGLSVYEAMAHGVPIVTRSHPSVDSWNAFKPCVLSSIDEYVGTAKAALGRRGEEIATAGREIVESRLTNIPRAVEGLYKALRRHGWQP